MIFQQEKMNGLCSDIKKLKIKEATLQKDCNEPEEDDNWAGDGTVVPTVVYKNFLSKLWASKEWKQAQDIIVVRNCGMVKDKVRAEFCKLDLKFLVNDWQWWTKAFHEYSSLVHKLKP